MNASLDDQVCSEIIAFSDMATMALAANRPADAKKPLKDALELLLQPKNQRDAYTWLNGNLGEAYFLTSRYSDAKEALFDGLNGPDGNKNPFLPLRLGQVLFELDDLASAKQYLARAHMLEGDDLFAAEDPKCIKFLKA